MSKLQWIVLLSAIGILLLLYFGCPTKPPGRTQIDIARAKKASTIDLDKLLERATKIYSPEQLKPILALERQLSDTLPDDLATELLKDISRNWNQLGDFALGGMYAEKVADISRTDSAWAITGTTYFSCFRSDRDSTMRSFCISKAIGAFESAISVAPDNPVHSVNLGQCYVEAGQQPMRGITIIRDVAEKHPENTLASMTLGRMSIRTAQYEKAVQRFNNVINYKPKNAEAHYWLGISHKELNQTEKAVFHLKQFINYSNNNAQKREAQTLLQSLES